MKEINSIERKLLRLFIKAPVPDYIRSYSDEKIDLMDCYEVGFVFAHDLLNNRKIDPGFSPWGDGNSVIFDSYYADLLDRILKENLSEDINRYCRMYLDVLEVFKKHFSQ